MTDTDLDAVHNLLARIFRDGGARRVELGSLAVACDVAQADVVCLMMEIDKLRNEALQLRRQLAREKAKGKG